MHMNYPNCVRNSSQKYHYMTYIGKTKHKKLTSSIEVIKE